MKKVILTFIALATVAASATTARLGSATFDQNDDSATIEARAVTGVKQVTVTVGGRALGVGKVKVVFRTGKGMGPYVSSTYHINKLVAAGQSFILDLPDNGYPVRRIEINGSASGIQGSSYVTAYGSN